MPRKPSDVAPRGARKEPRGPGAGRPPARIRSPGGRPDPGLGARKEPRQQRSREMVDAILQAAAAVLADQGYARATTNKIADRAGVSVGSLYQYFPGKDSLIAALLERHHAEVHDVVSVALARLADPAWPLEGALRRLVADLVALHRRDPALTRALSAAVLRESPAAGAKLHPEGDPAQAVAAVLASRPDVRSGHPMAMAQVVGQATEHLTRWLVHDAEGSVDPDALAEEVVQLLVRYLRV